jgi:hypothetical protein
MPIAQAYLSSADEVDAPQHKPRYANEELKARHVPGSLNGEA